MASHRFRKSVHRVIDARLKGKINDQFQLLKRLDSRLQPEPSLFNNFKADYSYKLSVISSFIDNHRNPIINIEGVDQVIIQNFIEQYPERKDWESGLQALENYFCTVIKPS